MSLPFDGHETTVKSRFEKAVEEVKERFRGEDIEIVNDSQIQYYTENGYEGPSDEHSYEWFLGEDVKDILTCDILYITKGYKQSRGCRIEEAVALADGKTVVYQQGADGRL